MKPGDVITVLVANLMIFFCIVVGCYLVGLPAWLAAILAVIAILVHTKYAVRLMSDSSVPTVNAAGTSASSEPNDKGAAS